MICHNVFGHVCFQATLNIITGHRSQVTASKLSPGVGEALRADASQYEGRALESAQGHSAGRAAAANTSPLRGGKLLPRVHSDADYHNAHEQNKNNNARWYLKNL